MEDRLNHIKRRLKKNKVYYSRYSPRSEMMFEVDEADEDLNWLVYEIERLREENGVLRQSLRPESEEPEGTS
jgi:hypothetical protein